MLLEGEKFEEVIDTLSLSGGWATTLRAKRGDDWRYITSISSPPTSTSIPRLPHRKSSVRRKNERAEYYTHFSCNLKPLNDVYLWVNPSCHLHGILIYLSIPS